MVGFDDRLVFMLLGCFLGYIIRYLQEIKQSNAEIKQGLAEVKEELDEVDEIVKTNNPPCKMPKRDEDGLVRRPLLLDAVLFCVVLLTGYAAWQTGQVNEDVQATQADLVRTQERLADVTLCNQRYLASTIDSLNERTQFTTEQAEKNIALQKSQSKFLAVVLLQPPATDAVELRSLEEYFDTLTEFVEVSQSLKNSQTDNPFPTEEAFIACLDGNEEALNDK